MWIFYLTIIITFILAIVAIILKGKKQRANLLITILIMSIFTLVSGLRSGIGDTYAYVYIYNIIGNDYDIMRSAYEPGFIMFLMLLKNISNNPQLMILVTSLIVNVFNIWVIRKYSENCFEMSVFLYMVSYYIVTMNGIRQALVASIIFLCTPLIVKRKFKTYALIMIILSTFHVSCLIMIPIYFISIREMWSRGVWMTIIIFLISMVFYDPVINLIFEILGNAKYAEYKDFNEGGANILRIAVYFIPVILSYLKREELKEWKYCNIFINMTLINFIIMGFSYYNWIFARFNIYTELYVIIALPYIIKKCFNNSKEKRVLYYSLIVLYLIFFIYDCKVSGIYYTTKFNSVNFFYNTK